MWFWSVFALWVKHPPVCPLELVFHGDFSQNQRLFPPVTSSTGALTSPFEPSLLWVLCLGGMQCSSQLENVAKHGLFSLCLSITAANLVLHQTVERIHVGKKYGDIPRGIFVVRGENVVLLGEIVSRRLALPALSPQLRVRVSVCCEIRSLPSPLAFCPSRPSCPADAGASHEWSCAGCGRGAERLFLLQDLEKESDTPLQQVSIEEILEEQRVEQQAKQESEKLKVQALKERGLCVPRADTLDEY